MPPLSRVARLAGEPLNLIEIGCSAGVLLTFDKYAYEMKGRDRLGPNNAPLTLRFDVHGGPEPHIPKIGKRIGLDLCLIDAKSEDERRWVLAQCFPDLHEWQADLAAALDVVAQTDISFYEGDALDLLPDLVATTPGPLCVFHSACLLYWSAEAKAQLHTQLVEASRGREIYRVGIEKADLQRNAAGSETSEIVISRYRDGTFEDLFVAHPAFDFGSVSWSD